MKVAGVILILLVFLSSGCLGGNNVEKDNIVCEKPYMRHGLECCLDKDNNRICDEDEETITPTPKTTTTTSIQITSTTTTIVTTITTKIPATSTTQTTTTTLPSCNPRADEICDGIDNNCNGDVDEGCPGPNLYTWFSGIDSETYNIDIDLRIDKFPDVPKTSLYFWALVADFSDGKWAHMGLQWARQCITELGAPDARCSNWGGDAGRNIKWYPWEVGKWYRYRIWRVDQNSDGSWRWSASIYDYGTEKEFKIGEVNAGPWLTNLHVFSETGYGIMCSTPSMQVTWRNPTYRSTAEGLFEIPHGQTSYNDACTNTNQWLKSSSPIIFVHKTNEKRTTSGNKRLW